MVKKAKKTSNGARRAVKSTPKTSRAATKKTRKASAGKRRKVIAFFPEAAFGPALNSVGIAQAVEKLGHKVVFFSDPGFRRGL